MKIVNKMRFLKIIFILIILSFGVYFIPYKKIITSYQGQEAVHEHSEKGHEQSEHQSNSSKNHKEEKIVKLTKEQIDRFNIQTIKIDKANFQHRLTLPGQVTLNENTITHVVASIPGIVKEIFKGLGEETKIGDPLATLQSRDMAEAKSAYISAHKNLGLKKDLFEREEKLWAQKIKAEMQFIQTRNIYETAKIDLEEKKQKLLALGMTDEQILELPEQKTPLNIYTINAPIGGRIIERHITLGEVISGERQVFVIANLDTVWVELAIPSEDLQKIKKEQKVDLFGHHGETIQSGVIMYVSPVINEESRTGKAVIQMNNDTRVWHPGDFVTAQIIVSEKSSYLSLPKSVIQTISGEHYVFLKKDEENFEAKPIQIKGSDKGEFVEILSGIQEGNEIVSTNTFLLKAELGKSEAEHSH